MAINPIALQKAAAMTPADLQAAQLSAEQQQAIAAALIQSSLASSPPVLRTAPGNPYARDIPNFGDPIGKVAEAYFGNKQMREANQRMSDLAMETNRRRQGEFGRITDALLGSTVEGERPPAELGGGPGAPQQVLPNYGEAVRIAQGSMDPAVQAAGAKLLEKVPTPEDYLKLAEKYDPESIAEFRRTLNPGVLKEKKKVVTSEGVAATHQEGKVLGTTPINKYQTDKETVPGMAVNKNLDTGFLSGISGGSTTPPQKYEEQYTAELTKQLGPGLEQYSTDLKRLANIGQAKTQIAALPDDKFGTAAGARQGINKFLELFPGAKQMPETANMEVLQGSLGKFILEDARKLAPVTQNDVDTLYKILGSEGFTKRGLSMMMDVVEKSTAQNIEMWRQRMRDYPLPPSVTREQHLKIYAPDFSVTPISAQSQPTNTPKVIKYSDW